MKWAIVMYALFVIDGETEEKISWGLTFPHHEQCEQFFKRNEDKVIQGLRSYSQQTMPKGAQLVQMGCAHATATFDGTGNQTPTVTLRMPLWEGTSL
tara:strand:+ start:200 stop:490 length:291 start_codon:yes stop_codon:yes gene_type:complete